MPKLIYSINGKKFSYKFDNYITLIGREDICNIILDDEKVSKRHCRIEFENGLYFIEDLASRNGTCINNKFVSKRTQLNHKDIITIGSTEFVFHKPPGLKEIFWMFFTNRNTRKVILFVVIVTIILLVAYFSYETFSKIGPGKPKTEDVEKK